MQNGINMEFRGLCSHNSGARQIQEECRMEITWNFVAYAVIILVSGKSKTLRQAGYTSHTEKTENAHKFPVFHTINVNFGDKYCTYHRLRPHKNCHSFNCFSTAW
jgi:hypothetical protein